MIKVVVVLLVAVGLAWLFVRSAQDARAEPYQIEARYLKGWTLGLDEAPDSQGGAVVSLRPPAEMAMNLFRQLFSRQMESMMTPSMPGIPLVRRGEVTAALAAPQLLEMARAAGLETAALTPSCVGHRRTSAVGVTRQLYYVLFKLAGFEAFRAAVAEQAGPEFRPDALAPVLMMAAQPDFAGWLPIGAEAARECIAPVEVE